MRRPTVMAAAALLAGLLLFAAVGDAGPRAEAAPPNMVQVIIAFDRQPGPAEEAIVRGAGGALKYTYDLVPAIAATVPQAALAGLQRNPRVLRVEPDLEVFAINAELDSTWGVRRIGAGTVHTSNRGAGIKVAVIDSGIDYGHPELSANYQGGWDFANNDNNPMDDNGHGTHVAGTIAAVYDDSGVVGVAPEAELYGLKVLNASGGGRWSDIIAALQWSANNDIKVTNNSYGSSSDPGATVKAAFDNSYAAGVLHVAAAGNSGHPAGKGDNVGYPARYPSVIAVAATGSSDVRASFSSTGPDVELAAPGVSILSSVPGGGYESWNGTSMASPHVAGVAALMFAGSNPSPTHLQVRSRLQSTADDLGSAGRDPHYGYGLVNAATAVGSGSTPTNTAPSVSWANPTGGTVSGTVTLQISASDAQDAAGTLAVQWQVVGVDGSNWRAATYNSGTARYEANWNTTQVANLGYTLAARATDSGNLAATASVNVTVGNSVSPPATVAVTGIAPNSMAAGSTVNVTISGSGFQTGAGVSFENGSGPAPVASNVAIVDGSSLTATFTVKGGGPQGTRVWDVRVTNPNTSSAVLPGGFSVIR